MKPGYGARVKLTNIKAPENMDGKVKCRIVRDILVIAHFGIYTLILINTLSTFVSLCSMMPQK